MGKNSLQSHFEVCEGRPTIGGGIVTSQLPGIGGAKATGDSVADDYRMLRGPYSEADEALKPCPDCNKLFSLDALRIHAKNCN